jgi:hypothetical protein
VELGEDFGGGRSGLVGEGDDLGCGEGVEPEGRETLLDGAKEGGEPCDGGGGCDFALEGGGCAAFGEDGFNFGEEWIEGGAVGGLLVVDAAVDGVADDAFGVQASTDGVGLHAEPD